MAGLVIPWILSRSTFVLWRLAPPFPYHFPPLPRLDMINFVVVGRKWYLLSVLLIYEMLVQGVIWWNFLGVKVMFGPRRIPSDWKVPMVLMKWSKLSSIVVDIAERNLWHYKWRSHILKHCKFNVSSHHQVLSTVCSSHIELLHSEYNTQFRIQNTEHRGRKREGKKIKIVFYSVLFSEAILLGSCRFSHHHLISWFIVLQRASSTCSCY
jgi:hypothetical protein